MDIIVTMRELHRGGGNGRKMLVHFSRIPSVQKKIGRWYVYLPDHEDRNKEKVRLGMM